MPQNKLPKPTLAPTMNEYRLDFEKGSKQTEVFLDIIKKLEESMPFTQWRGKEELITKSRVTITVETKGE